MAESFLSIILDTGAFLDQRYRNFEHLDGLILNGTIQIAGVEVHIPYAVKAELRQYAGSHPNIRVQNEALDARRWLADNEAGLKKQTWLENSAIEALFPGRPKDQLLHYANRQREDRSGQYGEVWLVTEDRLLQISARGNGLQVVDVTGLERQLARLFPVKYLNTKWMMAAMEHRMAREMAVERRKRAGYILVLEAGVLLKTKSLENFLDILGKDRRPDFQAGVQLDIPKCVLDQLNDVRKDIGCRYRHPEVLVERAMRVLEKYSPGTAANKDSHITVHVEELAHSIEGKLPPVQPITATQVHRKSDAGLMADYNEGLLRYCRRLVASHGDTHVVALLTGDGARRKLMRTEQFQVVTLWPE